MTLLSGTVMQYPLGIGSVITRVLEAGSGDSVLTFIHGVGARGDRWTDNVAAMARAGHRAFAFDLPGHGFATKGEGFDYTIGGYASLVRQFLDSVGVKQTVLVGTSMGGHIAARVACDAPDRVSRLVLVGTLGIVPLGPDLRQALSRSLRDTSRRGIEAKLRRVIHDDAALVGDSWITEEWRINNSPGADRAMARLADYFAEQVDDDVVGARLRKVAPDMPILLAWGEQDVLVPIEILWRCADVLPDASIAIIAAASHAPYRERPEAFDGAVIKFVDAAWGAERMTRF
jgi:pimeloyl-ACP methyl ester carboxylesterase